MQAESGRPTAPRRRFFYRTASNRDSDTRLAPRSPRDRPAFGAALAFRVGAEVVAAGGASAIAQAAAAGPPKSDDIHGRPRWQQRRQHERHSEADGRQPMLASRAGVDPTDLRKRQISPSPISDDP